MDWYSFQDNNPSGTRSHSFVPMQQSQGLGHSCRRQTLVLMPPIQLCSNRFIFSLHWHQPWNRRWCESFWSRYRNKSLPCQMRSELSRTLPYWVLLCLFQLLLFHDKPTWREWCSMCLLRSRRHRYSCRHYKDWVSSEWSQLPSLWRSRTHQDVED